MENLDIIKHLRAYGITQLNRLLSECSREELENLYRMSMSGVKGYYPRMVTKKVIIEAGLVTDQRFQFTSKFKLAQVFTEKGYTVYDPETGLSFNTIASEGEIKSHFRQMKKTGYSRVELTDITKAVLLKYNAVKGTNGRWQI